MTVSERIEKLRNLMLQNDIDAYVIPTADFHQSEYVGSHFKARAYISGFTGSYGTVLITKDDGRLWTDGRYFLQAETQLAGSGISLMKMNEAEVPTLSEWLADVMPVGGTLGFDGRVVSVEEGHEYETALTHKQVQIQYSCDLINDMWEDRPTPACEPVFILKEQYTGESTASKLKRVREFMHQKGATVHVIASLDDIAWLINMRGNDIEFFPMILSYAVIHKDSMDLSQ